MCKHVETGLVDVYTGALGTMEKVEMYEYGCGVCSALFNPCQTLTMSEVARSLLPFKA